MVLKKIKTSLKEMKVIQRFMKIILASASPRRKEILGSICKNFEIRVEPTDERLDGEIHPYDGVGILARRKGLAVYEKMADEERANSVIISSDTLVELDGEALGKPASASEAHEMLSSLSGKRHNVHTGIAVRHGERTVSGTATTGVYFRELSDAEINEYIATGEVYDKAGSYAIQGGAGKFVERIEGDFDTVVGFSVKLLYRLLSELEIDIHLKVE